MLEIAAMPTDLLESATILDRFGADSVENLVPAASPVLLKNLRSGQCACVTRLVGSSFDVGRLSEMGLRKGAEVTVIRNGITCILQLDGNRLCIRLSKDLTIWVTEA